MASATPVRVTLSALLSTQLLAAEVYAHFLALSSAGEEELWKKLLEDELDHVAHIGELLNGTLPVRMALPAVNVEKMREICAQAAKMGDELFLLRLEGALRLESAELDYGLEGLMARRLERTALASGYRFDVSAHLGHLLEASERYMESPNIGLQVRRLRELLETSLRDTTRIRTEEEQGAPPQS